MSSPGRCLDCLITVDCPLPLTQDDADLTNVSLPHLRRITGSITVRNNPALVRIVLPNLEAIGQSLALLDNPRLAAVELPNLGAIGQSGCLPQDSASECGTLALLDNPRLAAVELPVLETISHDFSVRGGGSDVELALPRLAAIGGQADVRDTTFAGLVMPMLDYIVGYFYLASNPVRSCRYLILAVSHRLAPLTPLTRTAPHCLREMLPTTLSHFTSAQLRSPAAASLRRRYPASCCPPSGP